jgi:diphosphomevalonate decarboxylase
MQTIPDMSPWLGTITHHSIGYSNIACLKYWGKLHPQTPLNFNISYGLQHLQTETTVAWVPDLNKPYTPTFIPHITCTLNGEPHREPKLVAWCQNYWQTYWKTYRNTSNPGHIHLANTQFPQGTFHITSTNHFPTQAGIASSASGYSALVSAFAQFLPTKPMINDNRQAARLGSGSACRSLWEHTPWVAWDTDNTVYEPIVHKDLKHLYHAVLLIDATPKSLTSSVGHTLVGTSAWQPLRRSLIQSYKQAFLNALAQADWQTIQILTEMDACLMHTVMQTATPVCQYFHTKTTEILETLLEFRRQTHVPFAWTLDAGPNIHLIAPPSGAVVLTELLANLETETGMKFISN